MDRLVFDVAPKFGAQARLVFFLHHTNHIRPPDIAQVHLAARLAAGSGGSRVHPVITPKDRLARRAAPFVHAANKEDVHHHGCIPN